MRSNFKSKSIQNGLRRWIVRQPDCTLIQRRRKKWLRSRRKSLKRRMIRPKKMRMTKVKKL